MIETVLTAAGLGLGAGVNAYATFLVFGLLARFYPELFQSDLATLFSSTPVLLIVCVLYIVEFLADKIPAVDHAWDAIHTFVRPLAGALVALASAQPDLPQPVLVIAALAGGGAALGSHSVKALTRGVSTTTTGGIASPILSILEDGFAIIQTLLAIFLPWLLLAVVVILGLPAVAILIARRNAKGSREA